MSGIKCRNKRVSESCECFRRGTEIKDDDKSTSAFVEAMHLVCKLDMFSIGNFQNSLGICMSMNQAWKQWNGDTPRIATEEFWTRSSSDHPIQRIGKPLILPTCRNFQNIPLNGDTLHICKPGITCSKFLAFMLKKVLQTLERHFLMDLSSVFRTSNCGGKMDTSCVSVMFGLFVPWKLCLSKRKYISAAARTIIDIEPTVTLNVKRKWIRVIQVKNHTKWLNFFQMYYSSYFLFSIVICVVTITFMSM